MGGFTPLGMEMYKAMLVGRSFCWQNFVGNTRLQLCAPNAALCDSLAIVQDLWFTCPGNVHIAVVLVDFFFFF